MPTSNGPILGLDSASLYFRSFYALPSSMTAPDGRPHNALRGFLQTVTRLVEAYQPTAIVAAWDDDWRPQWRVDLMPTYKSHRLDEGDEEHGGDAPAEAEEAPEELGPQVVALAALLDLMSVPRWGASGYEADDILGTVALTDSPTLVVSGDRDLVQLIDDSTRLLLTVNGGMEKWPLLDVDAATERFGLPPSSYAEMAVLRGDPSDGLPGVPGIGPKTAVSLISAFGSLDAVIAAAVSGAPERPMTARIAERIVQSGDMLPRALTVTQVVRDVSLPRAIPALRREADLPQDALQLATEWGVERQAKALQRAIALSGHTADE